MWAKDVVKPPRCCPGDIPSLDTTSSFVPSSCAQVATCRGKNLPILPKLPLQYSAKRTAAFRASLANAGKLARSAFVAGCYLEHLRGGEAFK